MLENACAKKRRFDPLRSRRFNFQQLNGLERQTDRRRMRYMIIDSGVDHCHSAAVLDTIRIRMKLLVQLR